MATATIKVDRIALIAAAEASIQNHKDLLSDLEARNAAHQAATKKWDADTAAIKDKLFDRFKKALRAGDAEFIQGYAAQDKCGNPVTHVTLQFVDSVVLPEQPKFERKDTDQETQYRSSYVIRELENTIKILNLSSEPTVPATMYRGVIDYI